MINRDECMCDVERTTPAKLHMHIIITCDQQLYYTRLDLRAQAALMQCVCEITNAWAQTHDEQKEEHRRSADSNRSVIDAKRDRMIDALNAWMNADSPSEYRAWAASASLLRVWAPVCSEHAAAVGLRSDRAESGLCGWRGNEMRWKCRGARDSSASTPVHCSAGDVTRAGPRPRDDFYWFIFVYCCWLFVQK